MGTVGRVGDQLAVLDQQPHARQRAAHRAGPDLLAERRAGRLARLGLAVAVADPQAGRVVERAQYLRVQSLAGGDKPAQFRRPAAGSARLAITRYSVGAMHSTFTGSSAAASWWR